MEFPQLGIHCAEPDCKQLDFLPFECDSCSLKFCLDHRSYRDHKCPKSHLKDKKVPLCPLCTLPVAILPGENIDRKMDEHISRGCKGKTIYNTHCHVKGCKRKELVPIHCQKCRETFCLRHRFFKDHDCEVAKQEQANRGQPVSGPFYDTATNRKVKAY